jgi:hypothetical protein
LIRASSVFSDRAERLDRRAQQSPFSRRNRSPRAVAKDFSGASNVLLRLRISHPDPFDHGERLPDFSGGLAAQKAADNEASCAGRTR